MIGPLLTLIVALSAVIALLRRTRRLPARALIISPRQSTVIARDGGVRSVQTAVLTMDPAELDKLWSPVQLENLARTYWRFLSRVTFGLIRVVYGAETRSVVLLGRPLTLLRFNAPEYLLEGDHGEVRWQIRDGLFVTRSGRGSGYLALDVRREGLDREGRAQLRIEVEVSNFYPAIAARFSAPVYEMTQSVIHVLVTHSFLRSLATLELAESKVGQLAEPTPAAPAEPTPAAPAEPTPAAPQE